jgi:ubiquinone/menaquinone biosynthesis C-methylase UbiE
MPGTDSSPHVRRWSASIVEENPMSRPQPSNAAETYEQYFVPAMFIPWAAILLRYASPRPGERVLDAACGTGIVARLAAPLVGSNGQVAALDINPAMLAVARAHPAPPGATIRWQEGDAVALPFPDGAFDVVLCQHGLQFVPDRAGAVREMRRVLAPGGRALVIVLQALARHPVFEALIESAARHLLLPVSAVMTPFALCDAGELRALFTAAGFGEVDIFPESITVRFPDPELFVPLAVISSAAAVPAFTQLEATARKALLEAVHDEVEPTVRNYRDAGFVTFPMFAHIARATK